MDKVQQNIIQQQQLDKFNIEKSVVGTEAYYIDQDIQKGMSQDEIIQKARSGVYKLTAENKKAGRVGQKYGESKKEDETKDALNSIEYKGFKYYKGKESNKYHIRFKPGVVIEPNKRNEYNSLEEVKAKIDELNSKESTEKKEEEFDHTFFDDYKLSGDERKLVLDIKYGRKPMNDLTYLHDESSNIDQKARNYLQKFMNK